MSRDRSMTLVRRLAYLALVLAYAQIVFGAIVRITGSGMGCGDHWPTCNGLWFPPLDNPDVIIEITHRWIAMALLVATIALVGVAFTKREVPGIGGRGGVLRAATLAAVLWIAPAILGAITVWLELPPLVVVVHLALAMTLLAVLALVVIRAGGLGAGALASETVAPRAMRASIAAAAIAFTVIILGGFTANVPGAAPACQGFPLCNGTVVTEGAAQTLHWTHRVFAFLFTFHALGMAVAARRRASIVMRRATAMLFGLVLLQILIAAVLVSRHLPPVLQSLHQAVGTLVWLTALVTAALAVRARREIKPVVVPSSTIPSSTSTASSALT